MAKSPTRISKGTSEPSCQKHDGSGIEEGCGGSDGSLEILCEAAVSAKPCQKPFDHPTSGMDGEANLAGLLTHDLNDDPGGVRYTFGGIGAIGEDPFDEWKQ